MSTMCTINATAPIAPVAPADPTVPAAPAFPTMWHRDVGEDGGPRGCQRGDGDDRVEEVVLG